MKDTVVLERKIEEMDKAHRLDVADLKAKIESYESEVSSLKAYVADQATLIGEYVDKHGPLAPAEVAAEESAEAGLEQAVDEPNDEPVVSEDPAPSEPTQES